VAGSFTVTALDSTGGTATGYRGTVHFTSSDRQAVLPANYTFTAGDNGVHSFSATLKTAGSRTITATDTVTSTITGKQTVTVTAAALSKLFVRGFPSGTAGISKSFFVTAQDAFGNTVGSYRGTVHFTSSDPQAVLPANYTFTASDNGSHTFSATLKTAGKQSITATDTVTSSITGTQSGISIVPAAASILVVTGFPSPITHGTAGMFTVTAKDAFGNVATGYHGTVHFTSSDSAAVLPANYTFVSSDKGAHSFSATLNTVGTQSITATDTVTPSITGTQTGINVTAADDALLPDGYDPRMPTLMTDEDWTGLLAGSLPESLLDSDLNLNLVPALGPNQTQTANAVLGASLRTLHEAFSAEFQTPPPANADIALGAIAALLGAFGWARQRAKNTAVSGN
jgi:hypothetical protein